MFRREDLIKALARCPNGDDPVVVMQVDDNNLDDAVSYQIVEVHNTPEGIIILRSVAP